MSNRSSHPVNRLRRVWAPAAWSALTVLVALAVFADPAELTVPAPAPAGSAAAPIAAFFQSPGCDAGCYVDANGEVHIVQLRTAAGAPPHHRVAYSRGSAGSMPQARPGRGEFPPASGPDADAYQPVLFGGRDGRFPVAAWVERLDGGCRLYRASWIPGKTAWGPAEAVIDRPADLIRFPHGAGDWVVWVQSALHDDDIWTSRRGPHGWSRPEMISHRDETEDLSPRAALDPAGRPWVVWAGSTDGRPDDIFLSRRREGRWEIEIPVSRPDDAPDVLPDLAISPRGMACAVWLGFSKPAGGYTVTAATSRDGASWSSEQQLGAGSFALPPRVSWSEQTGFLVVWGDGEGTVWYAGRSGDRWDRAKILHRSERAGSSPAAASVLCIVPGDRPGTLRAIPHLLR